MSFFLAFTPVKLRIECIEVFGIQFILNDAECFTESLEVHDFPCTQEAYRVAYFLVMDKAEDIVIGGAGFLFCCDLVKTTAAENLEKALFFVVQAVSCCDFIRTKIEKKEDETSYPA